MTAICLSTCNHGSVTHRSFMRGTALVAAAVISFGASAGAAMEGRVASGDIPIAGATVTFWEAGPAAPTQVGTATTAADGSFSLDASAPSGDGIAYLIARGGRAGTGGNNPAIALMTILGRDVPARITLNEMTTVASAYVATRFLDGDTLKGNALGLRIASGNLPNLVDPATGGYGAMIQDPLNSTQTPTMATLATLSTLLAGCITSVKADACDKLFAATTSPDGKAPTDTLGAIQSVVRNKTHKPDAVFALLDEFYPVPSGKTLRATPYMPYRSFAPTAWTLALKFAGGGLNAPGKIMFDSEGNAWTGDNFIVGAQSNDELWDGNLTKFSSSGQPLSPMTFGFTGGGVEGPGFGLAIDRQDRIWVNNTGSKATSLFDKTGKPLSPPEGFRHGGTQGAMQGIIVAPNGDIWSLDFDNDLIIRHGGGDPAKSTVYCEKTDPAAKEGPCGLSGPFHLAIDQQDRIWVANAVGNHVSRFPVSDPGKIEQFEAGHSPKGIAVDSVGNVWVSNTAGDKGLDLITKGRLAALKLTGELTTSSFHKLVIDYLIKERVGSVTMFLPDGSKGPGADFKAAGSIVGPWGIAVDGDDHVWVANFIGQSIVELCGSRPKTCPAGLNTGDPISPAGGYVGGGMQLLTDIQIDPAGNVWVANNWQEPRACFADDEPISTRCGGQGITVFYGMAAPVKSPLIGPARRP